MKKSGIVVGILLLLWVVYSLVRGKGFPDERLSNLMDEAGKKMSAIQETLKKLKIQDSQIESWLEEAKKSGIEETMVLLQAIEMKIKKIRPEG